MPLPAKWPEPWRNLLVATWRTDPALRPDCATVATWLEKMCSDFESVGLASYGPDPAVTDAEFGAIAPVGGSDAHAAPPEAPSSASHTPPVSAAAPLSATHAPLVNIVALAAAVPVGDSPALPHGSNSK